MQKQTGDTALCITCHHARMRTDICGIYCTTGFVDSEGKCGMYRAYKGGTHERTARKGKKVNSTAEAVRA